MLFTVSLSEAQLPAVTTSVRETVLSGFVENVPVSKDVQIHPISGKPVLCRPSICQLYTSTVNVPGSSSAHVDIMVISLQYPKGVVYK